MLKTGAARARPLKLVTESAFKMHTMRGLIRDPRQAKKRLKRIKVSLQLPHNRIQNLNVGVLLKERNGTNRVKY
ncbi:hypothetical protein NDU88_004484 [Pleurodeles waltl]|uniref:Uncharacterized protein n=1 Tax=Pleurodeles waltl TaxID=8319 RepID=A0AAV7M7Y7_PLEWA|nr:hypothetical protein NDU88_004484 [Pleurodeles waltl]